MFHHRAEAVLGVQVSWNHTCCRPITMPLYCLAPAETLVVSYIDACIYQTSVCFFVFFLLCFWSIPLNWTKCSLKGRKTCSFSWRWNTVHDLWQQQHVYQECEVKPVRTWSQTFQKINSISKYIKASSKIQWRDDGDVMGFDMPRVGTRHMCRTLQDPVFAVSNPLRLLLKTIAFSQLKQVQRPQEFKNIACDNKQLQHWIRYTATNSFGSTYIGCSTPVGLRPQGWGPGRINLTESSPVKAILKRRFLEHYTYEILRPEFRTF